MPKPEAKGSMTNKAGAHQVEWDKYLGEVQGDAKWKQNQISQNSIFLLLRFIDFGKTIDFIFFSKENPNFPHLSKFKTYINSFLNYNKTHLNIEQNYNLPPISLFLLSFLNCFCSLQSSSQDANRHEA